MALARAVFAALFGGAFAEVKYTYVDCEELKPLRKHYINNCTIAEYCLMGLASTGYLGVDALELANEGFSVQSADQLSTLGLWDLANSGFANDGFVFSNDDDSFIGNAEFANDGFVANLAWSNHGFFSSWSDFPIFNSNMGFFDDIMTCNYMLQCHEFDSEGAFGTCNPTFQNDDVPAPAILTQDCRPGWIGDGICDTICNLPRFMNDGGDCLPSNCEPESLGNNNCDTQCNWPKLDHDGGDCLAKNCDSKWLNDGECDAVCNWPELDYDGGDCPHGDQLSKNPAVEIACDPKWLGDGQCDPECNTDEFEFDNGDCLGYEILADA